MKKILAEQAPTYNDATATSTPYASWPTSPPTLSSPVPDTTSPVYPSRPIRPMPRKRIRDRLSNPDHIEYPPQPESSSPIFAYPYIEEESYALKEEDDPHRRLRQHNGACLDCGHDHSEGEELGSDEELDDGEREVAMGFSPDSLQMVRRSGGASHHDGLDGYDAFENMSNKKKRKIPGHGQNSLSADMANISLSQPNGATDALGDEPGYAGKSYGYVHNSPSTQAETIARELSGPGRGRYGRSGRGSMERRPLAPVQNEPGIISAAIANATQNMHTTNPLPSTPIAKFSAHHNAINNGNQENMSMVMQQQHAISKVKTPPQKTDFTFTPGEGEGRPVWPVQQQHHMQPHSQGQGYAPHPALVKRTGPTHGPLNDAQLLANRAAMPLEARSALEQVERATQKSGEREQAREGLQKPGSIGGHVQHGPPPPVLPIHGGPTQGSQPTTSGPPPPANAQPPPTKQRKPRPLARTLDLAARRRKLQKEYSNYNNPPKREDIWICEFCEYEAIFGAPPRALIWEYEKKDKRERERIEERRRLLEKAKMKGRGKAARGRGKKGSKKDPVAPVNNTPAPRGGEQYDDGPLEEEEEYYEEGEYGYEDADGQPYNDGGLPLTPNGTHYAEPHPPDPRHVPPPATQYDATPEMNRAHLEAKLAHERAIMNDLRDKHKREILEKAAYQEQRLRELEEEEAWKDLKGLDRATLEKKEKMLRERLAEQDREIEMRTDGEAIKRRIRELDEGDGRLAAAAEKARTAKGRK